MFQILGVRHDCVKIFVVILTTLYKKNLLSFTKPMVDLLIFLTLSNIK